MRALWLLVLLTAPRRALADGDSFQVFLNNARSQMEEASATGAFCLNDEFFRGGITGSFVYKVGDGTTRKYVLALKLVARKLDNGRIADRLGIYDITSIASKREAGVKDYCRAAVIGREFPSDLPGQTSFRFEDNNSESPYLALSIGEDGSIAISSPDRSEQEVTTSREKLLSSRAAELESAPRMMVGSERFLCLLQPGPRITLAFFPAVSDHRSAELLADLYEGARGLLPSPIGKIGDMAYYLDYDRKTGQVEAVAGPAPVE